MSGAVRQSGALAFALLAYLLAIAPMIYFVGFLGNFLVGKTIDSGVPGPPGSAVAIDTALVLAFALVHSLLARPAAKRWLRRFLADDLERPLYSAIAGLQFVALIWCWRPLPGLVWEADAAPLRVSIWALFWCGWSIVLAGALALGTTRLYGLAAVWGRFRRRPAAGEELAIGGPYRWIRHPLYTGTVVALWAAPAMSAGRLLLAALFTLYILVGQRLEEHDLESVHGTRFVDYRNRVGAYLPRSLAPFRDGSAKSGE